MFPLDHTLERIDPEVAAAIRSEIRRQEDHIELIASENCTSPAVLEATGSILTNKYAEGYPGRRYYGGCEHVDVVERLAIERAKQLYDAEHANVQPHCGSSANLAVFMAALEPGDTVLGMSIDQGGHLTHGAKVNFSGKWFNVVGYGLHPETEDIDYDQAERLAHEHKPKLILCGASAFSLRIDWQRFRAIADSVGAVVMADFAHYSGLIAAGLYPSPVEHCHYCSSTTHKSLRGSRGGFVLCKAEQAKKLDSAVFPGLQGGPLLHVIAGKAVAFKEAMEASFKEYQQQVLANARTMADSLKELGLRIVSGGTESHVFLVDLRTLEVTGKDAQNALDRAHITLNKNGIPNDPQPPMVTSGIRIGSPAVTTRGMKEEQCRLIAELIVEVLRNHEDDSVVQKVADKVRRLTAEFPIYERHEALLAESA
jgi:glycine hydroxymethyltransferase